MTFNTELICNKCIHQRAFACAAFPDGIPDEILTANAHHQPLPGQGNDLVFKVGEPSEDEYFFDTPV
ncbi:MAG: hypothetical protein HUU10_15240 [Bacteroidetes bacterium]|nr:hypothetical protein [Bacteroidota bacterium]